MDKEKKGLHLKRATKLKIIFAGLLTTVAAMFATIYFTDDQSYNLSWIINVTVEDGATDPAYSSGGFDIKKAGKFKFKAQWGDWENLDPETQAGFITALTIKDSAGEVIFETTGESLKAESRIFDLEEGGYTLEYRFLANQEDLDAYLLEHFGEKSEEPADCFKDGTWEREYSLVADESHPKAVVVGALFGLIFGGFLAALLMVLGTRDDKNVPKYDERQIAEQGKAYKYGFFTALMMLALVACSGLLQIEIPMEQSMLCTFVVVVMVAVMATPLIMKDAYFSLRENKRFLIIVVGILGLVNLAIGVGAIASGRIMADGKVSFMGGANLAAAALLIYIEIAIIIKSIIDKKED
ncbi:hypothetical protein SAMN02910368_00504 [Lachnospiraceae bacterium G11]|nr:hypothetical protein SAMN02910368_00504 [Lachnospiraceae bacterium G11]